MSTEQVNDDVDLETLTLVQRIGLIERQADRQQALGHEAHARGQLREADLAFRIATEARWIALDLRRQASL
jgi:hypothetical protein